MKVFEIIMGVLGLLIAIPSAILAIQKLKEKKKSKEQKVRRDDDMQNKKKQSEEIMEKENNKIKGEEGKSNFLIGIVSGAVSIFLGMLVELVFEPQEKWTTIAVILCAVIAGVLVLYLLNYRKTLTQKKKEYLGRVAVFLVGFAIATYISGLVVKNDGTEPVSGTPTVSVEPTDESTTVPTDTATNTPTSTLTNTLEHTQNEHDWRIISSQKATCVSTGVEYYECDCGEKRLEVLSILLEHSEVTINGYDSTCTTAGLTDGKKCSVCGVITKEQEPIKALGHDEVTVKGYAATCTTAGLTDGKKCSVCGVITKEQEPIKALGHDEVTMKGYVATCTTTGLTDGKKCSVCGVVTKEQEPINVLGHNEEIVKGYASTCTATGLTDGKQCEKCKVMTVAQQIIPAIGHAYSNDTDLDCNNCGYVKGYWSDYGEWSTWQDTSVTGSIYREVGTQDVVAAYNPKTQYKYSRYYGHNGSYWVALEYQSGYCQTYEETEWLDAPMQWSNVWSNQQNRNNDGYGYGVASDGKSAGKKIFWYNEQTQEVDDLKSPIYKTQYRYRDRYIIYY